MSYRLHIETLKWQNQVKSSCERTFSILPFALPWLCAQDVRHHTPLVRHLNASPQLIIWVFYSHMLPSVSHVPLNLDKQDAYKSVVGTEASVWCLCKSPPQDRCSPVSHSERANPDAHQTDTSRCRNVLLLISPQSALLWLSQAQCLWFICCQTVESIYFSPSIAWFFLWFQMIVVKCRQAKQACCWRLHLRFVIQRKKGKNSHSCLLLWPMLCLIG